MSPASEAFSPFSGDGRPATLGAHVFRESQGNLALLQKPIIQVQHAAGRVGENPGFGPTDCRGDRCKRRLRHSVTSKHKGSHLPACQPRRPPALANHQFRDPDGHIGAQLNPAHPVDRPQARP
jgi:hypothetical protein